MKKLVVLVLLMTALLVCSACETASDEGEVIATVNDQPVYADDYQYMVSNFFMQYYLNYYSYMLSSGIDLNDEGSAASVLGQMEKDSLDQVIEAELIKQLAADYGITMEDSWQKEFLDPQSYHQFIVNSLYNALCEKVQTELADSVASEDEMKAAYDADPAAWNARSSSNIIILCDFADEAASAAAYEEAVACIEELKNGVSFEELFTKYSDDSGSEIGYVNADSKLIDGSGALVPEYTEGLFALEKEGDYTLVPVASSYGYHVIRLNDILDTFEEVKPYLEASMGSVSDDAVMAEITAKLEAKKAEAVIEYESDIFKYYTAE